LAIKPKRKLGGIVRCDLCERNVREYRLEKHQCKVTFWRATCRKRGLCEATPFERILEEAEVTREYPTAVEVFHQPHLEVLSFRPWVPMWAYLIASAGARLARKGCDPKFHRLRSARYRLSLILAARQSPIMQGLIEDGFVEAFDVIRQMERDL
jgi:hypothetical protein